jgi:hypothetical protein
MLYAIASTKIYLCFPPLNVVSSYYTPSPTFSSLIHIWRQWEVNRIATVNKINRLEPGKVLNFSFAITVCIMANRTLEHVAGVRNQVKDRE